MPINYPSEGGKENSQRESDEALGWETGLLAHTHTHKQGFHIGTHMQKFENMDSSVQTHVRPRETITHPQKRRISTLKCLVLMAL